MYLKLYLSGSKNRNQRVHMGGLVRRGAYMSEAYTRRNISGKEEVGLSAGEPIRGGGGLQEEKYGISLVPNAVWQGD